MANNTTSYDDQSFFTLNNSKFSIELEASVFSDESYTVNYINGLFKNIIETLKNCQSIVNYAKNYFNKNEEISKMKLPDIVDLEFDFGSLPTEKFDTNATVNIQSGTLNVRESPNGAIIGKLEKDSNIKVVERNSNWTKIEMEDGKTAYVYSDYVKMNDNNTKPVQETIITSNSTTDSSSIIKSVNNGKSNIGVVNITDGNLNVRKSPNGEIITKLQKGCEVEILGQSETNPNWTKVLIDGNEAYIFSKYLKVKE